MPHTEIAVDDGTRMLLHVDRPAMVTADTPAAIVLQDAFGMTTFLDDVRARVAELGFIAVTPELYHRTGTGVSCPYEDRTMSANRAHMKGITPEGVEADLRATHTWIVGHGGVRAENIASIGFCMGGTTTYVANAMFSLRAAVSFYGNIREHQMHYAEHQRGPILMFWGDRDPSISKEKYRAVADALTAGNARHEQVVFSDADHGFFCHVRPWCYDEKASRQAWALVTEFFRNEGLIV